MQDRKPTYIVQPYQTTHDVFSHIAREINNAASRAGVTGEHPNPKRRAVFQAASTVMLNAYGHVGATSSITNVRGSVDVALKALATYRKSTKPKSPSVATMTKWMNNGIAKATDGCRVEPDGTCAHGKRSWLLEMGVI